MQDLMVSSLRSLLRPMCMAAVKPNILLDGCACMSGYCCVSRARSDVIQAAVFVQMTAQSLA